MRDLSLLNVTRLIESVAMKWMSLKRSFFYTVHADKLNQILAENNERNPLLSLHTEEKKRTLGTRLDGVIISAMRKKKNKNILI